MSKKQPEQMSALCVAQPWAQCIFQHGKNVENRNTNLLRRGTIAIYASISKKLYRFEACEEEYGLSLKWDELPKGALLGFVDIVDVVTDDTVTTKTKKWFVDGCYGYVLENPIRLKTPVPAKPPKGAISFWHLKGKTLDGCLRQLPQSQLSHFKPWEKP